MSTEINVRGHYSMRRSPERVTVRADIGYEGPAMEPVYQRAAQHLEILQASITPLTADFGAVTWWAADQIRTWSDRPWNQAGDVLPVVHHASVGVQVVAIADAGMAGAEPNPLMRASCSGIHPDRCGRRHLVRTRETGAAGNHIDAEEW
jgi:hypothetical protein